MNQLVLLAQLCGEGRATEALLRDQGFTDLESLARADTDSLAAALDLSDRKSVV